MASFPFSTSMLSKIKSEVAKYSSCDYVSPIVPAMADHCTTGDLIKIYDRTENGFGRDQESMGTM